MPPFKKTKISQALSSFKKQGGFINYAALLSEDDNTGINYGTYEGGSYVCDGTDYLSRTFGTPTSNQIFTVSIWLKRSRLGSAQYLLSAYHGSGQDNFYFDSSDRLAIQANNGSSSIVSTAVFRDTHKWMHIVYVYDTTDGTEANRLRIYVDGLQLINFDTENYPALNAAATQINASGQHRIGLSDFSGSGYFEGYLARYDFIDGTAYEPTEWGETSESSNKWVMKEPSGLTYGNNGFYIDFNDDRASSPDDASNVYDQSGNGNDWTLNSGDLDNYTNDTPVNNYATLQWERNAFGTLSNGNTDFLGETSARGGVRTSLYMQNDGKYAAEFTDMTVGIRCGLVNQSVALDGTPSDLGTDTNSIAISITESGSTTAIVYGGSTVASGLASFIKGTDVLRIEFDLVTGNVAFYKNTTLLHTETITINSGDKWFFCLFDGTGGARRDGNYRSGAKGFINTPSSEYVALSSANLPTDGTLNIDNVMQVVTATEDNIISDTNTAVSGYTNWFKWLKNRDSAESHYFIFSDDASNYVSSDDAANGKQSLPSLSGTNNWVGHCFNADGVNINMGTQSHTNGGGDTTITHGLGTTNIAIFMLDEAGGDFHVYHPSLDSGKLVYFDKQNNQTTDAAIKNVTSTTFDIDTSEATGTKRWFVFNGDAPCIDLGDYTGNTNADGAFVPMKLAPRFVFGLSLTATAYNWVMTDIETNSNNTARNELSPNDNAVEATGTNRLELLSNGAKNRDNGANWNDANKHITIAFGMPIAA